MYVIPRLNLLATVLTEAVTRLELFAAVSTDCHRAFLLLLDAPSAAISPSISLSRARLGTCGQEREELIGDIGGEQRGDLPWIVGRKHLHHIAGHEAQALQSTQETQRLPAGGATDLGRAGARGVGGVDEVHVEGKERGARGDPLAHRLAHRLDAPLAQLVVVYEG